MATINGAAISLDPGQVGNQEISSTNTKAIQYFKLQPWVKPWTNFATAIAGTPSAREEVVYVASGAGVILGFHAKLHAAGGSTAVTVDIKKNGSSIATGSTPIAIGNTTAVVDGTVATSTFAAGDEISLALAGTFTGAQGPYAWISLYETNAPTI